MNFPNCMTEGQKKNRLQLPVGCAERIAKRYGVTIPHIHKVANGVRKNSRIEADLQAEIEAEKQKLSHLIGNDVSN